MPDLLHRERERREQLHRDFDNRFIHDDCRRRLGSESVATKEVANGLEKFDQFIVVINNALDHLTHLTVTKMRTQGQTRGTHRGQNNEACLYGRYGQLML